MGLVVPGAGPTVTRDGARAALVRGRVRNAVLGGTVGGKPLIRLAREPAAVTIYVALPPEGETHNVRRYPVAIVGPGYGVASAPAVSGYPAISVPTGLTDEGLPGGVWLSAGFLSEATLLAFAFDLESAVGPRPLPTFRGTVPGDPPDAGICATPVDARHRATRADLADAP